MGSDILLISTVGFAAGWVPLNIRLLRKALGSHGITATLLFHCVEFSNTIRMRHPYLMYIDNDIGEWGFSFHEQFFAGKVYKYSTPEQIMSRLVKLRAERSDIYDSYDFRPSHEGFLRHPPPLGNPEKYFQDLLTYCKLLDSKIKERLQELSKEGFWAVGFSCNSAQFFTAIYATRFILEDWQSRPLIIFGGPLFEEWNIDFYRTYFPEISYIVQGDGEKELIRILCEHKDSRSAGLVVIDRVLSSERDIHISVDHDDGVTELAKSNPDLTFMTWLSKNCSYARCTFCADTHVPFRVRDPVECFNDIRSAYEKHGITCFGFGEPDLNGDPRKLEALCDLLIQANLPCSFWAEVNARNTTRRLLVKMQKAGFRYLQIGIESFSSTLLRKMRKPANVIDNVKVLKWALDARIDRIYYNLICNFPGESHEDILETLQNASLFSHLLSKPFCVALAEFELHRPAQIFQAFAEHKSFPFSNYKFFSESLPPVVLSKMPCFRVKPHHPPAKNEWEIVVHLIEEAQNRSYSLYYEDIDKEIRIFHLRGRDMWTHSLVGGLRDVFAALAVADDLLSTEDIARLLKKKYEFDEVSDLLKALFSQNLIYSERNRHVCLAVETKHETE